MNIEQLEKLGIEFIGSKINPRDFHIPHVGNFKISENYSMLDIFEIIYNRGIQDGIEKGKEKKIEEIKNVLNIYNQEIPF